MRTFSDLSRRSGWGVVLLAAMTSPAMADLGYDLRANAPLAHVYRDGAVADAASPGFVKYTRDKNGRWKYGATHAGRPAAFAPGLQANLWLPVGPEQAGKALVLEAAFHAMGSKQALDVFVAGKKIGSPAVKSGWQNIRVKVPEGRVKPGLVKVRLHFRRKVEHQGMKTAAAVRFVRLTSAAGPAAPTAEADTAAALRALEGDALVLPDGAGLDYYITPVKGLKLKGKARGGTAEVWAQLDGKKPRKLGGGAALNVSLDKLAGQAVRLMLRGKGGVVKLDGARIAGAASPKVPAATKPKYVVFWLIDTLRADKLSFYKQKNANGRPKVKTPHLDALAKESTIFDPFWVQGNESKASHASLFTGTYPTLHGVHNHAAKLRSSHTTIAEAFKAAGYRTGGFVSNGYVSAKWNFAQGFKDFQNFIREGKPNNARAVVKKALPWIDKHKAKPFYLYLGTSDPHVTYRAHKKFIAQYDRGSAYTGRYKKHLSGGELGKLKGKKSPPKERDRVRIEALYENEIAFNDHHFGRLVAHLKKAGIYDETMIIVSADHGDEFWEHGGCGHGHNLHQELVRVPLVIKYPAAFPKGVSRVGADGVDLLPTITALLGQKTPKDVQGRDLRPELYAKGAVYPSAVMASMGTGSYALEAGRAKVIFRSEASVQVYDVKKDRGEKNDLFGKRPVLTLAAMDPLSLFMSRAKKWKKTRWGSPNNLQKGFK